MAKTRAIPYHLTLNGLTERLNRTIISMIQKAVSEEEYDQDGYLPKLFSGSLIHRVYSISSDVRTFSGTTGPSLYQMSYGLMAMNDQVHVVVSKTYSAPFQHLL